MPTDIIETATKGTTLSVPIGTDKRKAASLMAAWQAIGDRLLFVENFYDLLKVFILGGVLDTANGTSTTLRTHNGPLVVEGEFGGDGLKIGTAANAGFYSSGRCKDALFTPGDIGGMANKKPFVAGVTSANFTFNPLAYDLLDVTPGAAISVTLAYSGTPPLGAHFRVLNRSNTSGHFISVYDPTPTLIHAVDRTPFSSPATAAFMDFYWNGTAWTDCGTSLQP